MTVAPAYQDQFWTAHDGSKLHYRDYPGAKDKLPLICIPGLTRNARDFAHVADRVGGSRRVLCVELRGRGESSWGSSQAEYVAALYLADLLALLDATRLKAAIVIGTSLGGILTMLLANARANVVRAALINDIGPVIEPGGLRRIQASVGKAQSWPTWVHAARDLEDQLNAVYPGYDPVQWVALAKRLYKLSPQGRIVPDYDPRIGEAARASGGPPDADALWNAYDALGDAPVTILRGALSDILSAKTARDMARRLPNARLVTVASVGHAPALDEPASLRAIDALLRATGK